MTATGCGLGCTFGRGVLLDPDGTLSKSRLPGTVPLYGQTWLRQKESGYVALKPLTDKKRKVVRFQLAEWDSMAGLGFDPGEGGRIRPRYARSARQRWKVLTSGNMGIQEALVNS